MSAHLRNSQSGPVKADATVGGDLKMQDAIAYMDKVGAWTWCRMRERWLRDGEGSCCHVVLQVKEVFADRQEVYVEFLDIIKAFQEHRIDTPGVIGGVTKLFQGHEDLLQGFNAFLPEGHRMPPPKGQGQGGYLAEPPKPANAPVPPGGKALQMTDAMKYMDKVRDTFQNKPEIYLEFLDIMKSFQAQK
jgi:histone deacetylase complex regulatory component SIN3